jgi:PhnB protein
MTLGIQPYLVFENSLAASRYYEEVFGAKVIFRLPGNPGVAAHFGITDRKPEDITVHGAMILAGHQIAFADNFAFGTPANAAFLLTSHLKNADETAELEALWAKVSQHDSVNILEEYKLQAFGGKEGFLLDQFGIRWHFVAEPDFSEVKPG